MAEKQYSVKIVGQQSWKRGANGITVAKNNFAATSRAQADIDAVPATEKIVFDLEGNPEAILLRVRFDGNNNDSNVIDLWLGRQGDHYLQLAQLTILQGLQPADDDTYFGDNYTPANEPALFDGEETTIANSMGLYFFKTLGFDKLVIIAPTLTATTIYVDIVNVNV